MFAIRNEKSKQLSTDAGGIMRLGDMSRGEVEQRLDVKEHGEETTRSGFAKRQRHVAMM
jgi:hypothetical protein